MGTKKIIKTAAKTAKKTVDPEVRMVNQFGRALRKYLTEFDIMLRRVHCVWQQMDEGGFWPYGDSLIYKRQIEAVIATGNAFTTAYNQFHNEIGWSKELVRVGNEFLKASAKMQGCTVRQLCREQ